MLTLVPDEIEEYAARHASPPGEIYDRLREETWSTMESPQMQVGRIEGRFLKLVTQLVAPRVAVEVGTFTGYSALSIAEGLTEGARLYAIDRDPVASAVARRYFAEAPWGGRIEHLEGEALEMLEQVPSPVDLAFVDADKENYGRYWDALVPRLRPGGVILVDNVLWSGSVLHPETESARAIVALNERAARDDRVEQVLLTVRDGILMARKR